jgi:hypothetical protein
LVGGLAFILAIGTVVVFVFLGDGGGGNPAGRSTRATANASAFDAAEYLENANALRGNTYRVQGTVEEQLRWTRDRGRLISVQVDGASPVPVLVPQELSHVNIEKNSRLLFVVEVADNGMLVALEVRPG